MVKLTSFGLTSAPESQAPSVAEEEDRINNLQNRLAELRLQVCTTCNGLIHLTHLQKELLMQENEPQRNKSSVPSKSQLPPSQPLATEADPHEEAFWFTPATPARTLRFTEKLIDEEMDFEEVSAISLDSPGPAAPHSGRHLDDDNNDDALQSDNVLKRQDEGAFCMGEDEEDAVCQVDVSEGEGEEERTVVLGKITPSPSTQLPDLSSVTGSEAHPEDNKPLMDVQSATVQVSKAKIRSTPELERIVVRKLFYNWLSTSTLACFE